MNELILHNLEPIINGRILPSRRNVLAFERVLQLWPQAKDLTKLYHHFGPGVYMRELHIPANMVNTGAIHKYPCINILAKGRRLTVVDYQIKEICAPHIHVSPRGSKRVSYTLEDSVWITVHENPDNCTDTDELVNRLTCNTEEEYQAFLDNQARLQ